MHKLNVIRFPSGHYGFVGSVLFALAYIADKITPQEVRGCMTQSIARSIAERRGGCLKTRTFSSSEQAAAFAVDRGYGVM